MSLSIFPSIPTMAWNSKKIQRWNTVVVQKSGNGRRKSLCRQTYPEWEIQCSYTALDDDAVEQAAGFFAMVRGQHQPFLWLDSEDYRETAVRIGTGNGTAKQFQLLRNLGDFFVEPARDIVSGTLTVYVDDDSVPAALGDDGLVALTVAPAVGTIVTATFQYYWRVAFADDIDWDNFWYGFYKLNTIKLVTVR